MKCLATAAILTVLANAVAAQVDQPDAVPAWPQFRGRHARGVADGFATPLRWDVTKGEGVRWKTAIPGLSHASPIVWGDRLYVTTAVKDGEAELKVGLYGSVAPVQDDSEHEFRVLCLDRRSGEIVWSRTAWQGVPKIKRHPKGSHAASTPATDGERVVALFGSEGLYCFDRDGKLLWKRDLGVLDAGWWASKGMQWGFGSSPVIHDRRVYVQCDVQGQSFVAAFDAATGEELWRTPREEVPTWSTPTVHVGAGGRAQLIANGWKHIGGYDLATGVELWRTRGGGDIPVPTPVVAHDLIFICSAHGRVAPTMAIRVDAEGEFKLYADQAEQIAWGERRGGNYMQTPLVYGDLLYCCRDNGVLTCFDARTGEQHYRERIEAGVGFTASGVAADGKLYFTSEVGDVHVVKPGKQFEALAKNPLGEECMATPAISRGTLYFRARRHLIAVGGGD